MNKWIAEFELEDGDTMPEHMDLEYKGAKIDFHCKPLEQEPTAKNDSGVDAVSRKELLKIYEDRFSELQKLKHLKENKGAEDRQMGVNYCINILKEMPSVTPIRPKGHWKLVQRGKYIDICCSNCKAVRIKEYAYNYTIDQLDREDVKGCLESDDMRYCPNCGADMREVEE